MKRIVLIYGLIAGVIAGGMLMITIPLYDNGVLNMDHGEWLGYTVLTVALSLIFFGVKSYRDHYKNGVIAFGQALKVGVLITLVASLVYVVSWEIIYRNLDYEFFEKFSQLKLDKMRESGATEAAITEKQTELARYNDLYKVTLFRAAITLMEITPLGILLSLISAGLLRKKEFLPSETN
jgi:hypothetical protein